MTAMVSDRRLSFGVKCAQCDNELSVPEWSEYRSKQQNRHLWRCWNCDFCFETVVNTMSAEGDAASLLVA